MAIQSFGAAGFPLAQFDVRLPWGMFIRVAVWETRRLMRLAAKVEESHVKDRMVYGANGKHVDRRCVAVIHLVKRLTDDGTVLHELLHAMRRYEPRVRRRFHDNFGREEHVVSETETAYLALRSQIAEEQRLDRL